MDAHRQGPLVLADQADAKVRLLDGVEEVRLRIFLRRDLELRIGVAAQELLEAALPRLLDVQTPVRRQGIRVRGRSLRGDGHGSNIFFFVQSGQRYLITARVGFVLITARAPLGAPAPSGPVRWARTEQGGRMDLGRILPAHACACPSEPGFIGATLTGS